MSRQHSPEPLAQRITSWIVVGLAALMASLIDSGVDHMRRMSDSVNELNKNIAVIIERLSTHEKMLTQHESEIQELQHKKR